MIPRGQSKSPREPASPFEVVFTEEETARGPRRAVLAVCLLVALAAHGALSLAARGTEPSLETWSANLAALVHADLAESSPTAIDLSPHPPSPEPAQPERALPEPAPRKPTAQQEAPTESPSPLAPSPTPEVPKSATPTEVDGRADPAQAGEILAADASAGPVDFTDDTFVVGSAHAYVGGATTRSGTGQTARSKDQVRSRAPTGAKQTITQAVKGPSKARTVRLPAERWRCAWPKVALDQDIYEQFVVLRVSVAADGHVETATLLEDPGHGFGAAALSCAKSTRFDPALDVQGTPIPSTSPPIRVRFTR